MRVVALFRVSTEKQQDEGSSLESQQSIYRKMAKERGWETVGEFRGCESATQAASDRRVLQDVLRCIRDQPVDAVYVHEQSRLTRGDELEVALLMRELKERGTKIIVNGVIRDLSSIDERFMVGIQSLVDRAESERIKERLMRGKKERARQGKRSTGEPPYGYTNPRRGEPNHGTLAIVEEEAAVIRAIFSMAVGGKSVKSIAGHLSRLGIAGARGGAWGSTSIRNVLQNHTYAGIAASGVWVPQKGKRYHKFDPGNPKAILIPDAHPAIIDKDTWDAVQTKPDMARTATPRVLTGMLFVNGEPFSGDYSRGQSLYRAGKGIRGMPWLGTKETDDHVWDAFASLATSEAFVQRLLEAANPRDQQINAMEIDHLATQAGRLRRKLENFIEMRAEGDLTKEQFRAKSAEAEGSLARTEKELAEARAKAAVLDGSHAHRVVRAVQTVLAGRTRLTAAQRREVLRSIVSRIDAEVAPTGNRQPRDANGRVTGSGGERWKIGSVKFTLALPTQEAAPVEPAIAEQSRGGQLTTTCLCCVSLAETENGGSEDDRPCHLDTTFSGCGLVAVTVGGA